MNHPDAHLWEGTGCVECGATFGHHRGCGYLPPLVPFGAASLRCGDPQRVLAIAAGGGPRYENDDLHIYCPVCSCNMSQDAYEPNGRTEACTDYGCLCHREEA